MSLQRFPCGVHIARPEKRGIPLHAGVAVAMQRIRSLIRPVDLRALPVQAIPHQPRWYVKRIAFIRPPSINAESKIFAMLIPVATGFFIIKARNVARIVNRSAKLVRKNYYVHHSAKMLLVQFIQHMFGIGENAGIPYKRAILRVPARGAETCSQINQRIARQFFLAEGLSFGKYFLAAREGAVRLLIAKTP